MANDTKPGKAKGEEDYSSLLAPTKTSLRFVVRFSPRNVRGGSREHVMNTDSV